MGLPIADFTNEALHQPTLTQSQRDFLPTEPRITFRLLDLPTELILRILGFAVNRSSQQDPTELDTVEDFLDFHYQGFWREEQRIRETLKRPAITMTCHFMRTEGMKMHYANNTFKLWGSIQGLCRLKSWLRRMTAAEMTRGVSVHVHWPNLKNTGNKDWNDFVGDVSNLIGKLDISSVRTPMRIFIRTREGKILFGRGELRRCYQVSFWRQSRGSNNGDTWISLENLHKLEICRDSKDFWTLTQG